MLNTLCVYFPWLWIFRWICKLWTLLIDQRLPTTVLSVRMILCRVFRLAGWLATCRIEFPLLACPHLKFKFKAVSSLIDQQIKAVRIAQQITYWATHPRSTNHRSSIQNIFRYQFNWFRFNCISPRASLLFKSCNRAHTQAEVRVN